MKEEVKSLGRFITGGGVYLYKYKLTLGEYYSIGNSAVRFKLIKVTKKGYNFIRDDRSITRFDHAISGEVGDNKNEVILKIAGPIKICKTKQEESKMKIETFEQFKEIAKSYLNEVENKCKYITFDCDLFYQYDKKPSINCYDDAIFKRYGAFNTLPSNYEFCENKFYISIEDLKENNPPNLKELPNCCEIITRDGGVYYNVNKLEELCKGGDESYSFGDYNENLIDLSGVTEDDIMKITSPDGNLIWEREEVLEKTMADLEEDYGKKVKIVKEK